MLIAVLAFIAGLWIGAAGGFLCAALLCNEDESELMP